MPPWTRGPTLRHVLNEINVLDCQYYKTYSVHITWTLLWFSFIFYSKDPSILALRLCEFFEHFLNHRGERWFKILVPICYLQKYFAQFQCRTYPTRAFHSERGTC